MAAVCVCVCVCVSDYLMYAVCVQTVKCVLNCCGIMRGFTTEQGVGQCATNRTEQAKVLSNKESGLLTNKKCFRKQTIKFSKGKT